MTQIIYNPTHLQHTPKFEYVDGKKFPHGDTPDRVEKIRTLLDGKYAFQKPTSTDQKILGQAHDPKYIEFLRQVKSKEYQYSGEFNKDHPDSMMTPYSIGTSTAAFGNVSSVLTATENISKETSFVLTRPPGHHAGYDHSMGICYLNNAFIAARDLVEQGYSVAILDFDNHHGNGTQDLTQQTNLPIKFVSIHESPDEEQSYLHKSGFTDENTTKTMNIPMADNCGTTRYLTAATQALDFCSDSDILVVSAGFDISPKDPHSRLSLDEKIFKELGNLIIQSQQKKIFLLEGGYYQGLETDVEEFLGSLG
ncbi:hypothetical protein ACFL0V_05160 [Nanoarchaeota archaeon]